MNDHPQSLEAFFQPGGIVIVGASADSGKLGHNIARNLINIGYPGAIHFVNPHGGRLFDKPVYTTLLQVPEPVELAVILIPAPSTPQALRDCGERGIRAVIVASGGFRETGPEGARLENELLEIARQYGIRLIGPNCIGVIDTHIPLDTTFLKPPPPPKGNIAFISHSGATCAAVVDWSRGQGFGFSRLVSLGNQIDVNETDMLQAVVANDNTQSLALYLESISHGRRFVAVAREVSRKKPLIVLKAGRYASGQRAAASHTGALAGQDTAYEAAFRRAGVIRANTVEELFEWARTLASSPLPTGRSMAVLTDAGGMGVTASDALEANGLKLAELSTQTRTALKAILPPAASTHNPVDMLASATPEQYTDCLRLLLADPNVDGALVILLPAPIYSGRITAEAMVPVIKNSQKPVLTALVGDLLIQDALEVFHRERIPEFRFPERAAAALAVLAKRAEVLAVDEQEYLPVAPQVKQYVRGLLSEPNADSLEMVLNHYGIPTLVIRLASNAQEAVQAAREVGFPVVLKIASPDITHKSDIGGVILNLADEASVRTAFDRLIQRAQGANPHARIEGVSIQHMAPDGQEVILGALQDATFGPMVMFGSGGIEVEGLKDVAFALAPLTRDEAERMLEETWAGRKLKGFRSLAPADRQAVLEALLRTAQLAYDFPEFREWEINPLRVLAPGQGVIALDIRTVSG